MNNKHSEENIKIEIDAINVQIIASIISIGTVLISILLLYNQKLEMEEKEPILNATQTQKLSTFNRTLILIIVIVFLIINFLLYKISKEEGEDLKPYNLQLVASVLTVIASGIALYVVLQAREGKQISDVENPVI
ncbi:MAG: hypothetical protein E7173_00205 [Firmicutes bacterium]|nr:hypothetical protein [Bacillota bacterium]